MAKETKLLANFVFALGLMVVLGAGTIVAVSATTPTPTATTSKIAGPTSPSPTSASSGAEAPVAQPARESRSLGGAGQPAGTGETSAGMAAGEVLGALGLLCMLVGMVMLSRERPHLGAEKNAA